MREAFSGPGNLAKRLSRDRQLHFKSADAWMDYNDKFGVGHFREAVIYGSRQTARNIALMEGFGTNPEVMFESIRTELMDIAQDRGDVKAVKRLRRRALDNIYRNISGQTSIPHNEIGAEIAAGIRAWQSMAKLGGATITSVSDMMTMANETRYLWGSYLDGYRVALLDLVEGRREGEMRIILDDIGVGIDGIIGGIASRVASTDMLPGRIAKLQQTFFKFNLLSWWTDAHKAGMGQIMARRLARDAETKAWGDLDWRTKRALELYEIREADWEVIKTLPQAEADGRTYISPSSARHAHPAAVDRAQGRLTSTQRRRERYRMDLETKLRAYYTDQVDHGIPTPGARESAVLNQGFQPGTIEGDGIRFIMQFKQFPARSR